MHRVNFTASEEVMEAIRELGRTEDVHFSPDNRRLAVAGFLRNKIIVFDVDVTPSPSGVKVELTGFQEIISDCLNLPHGLSFIDNDTLIVTNRQGDVPILKLPPRGSSRMKWEVSPTHTIRSGQISRLYEPGSVTVAQLDPDHYTVLVCDGESNQVTRHILESDMQRVEESSVALLSNGLSLPDGVAFSKDGNWIAVCNHGTNSVALFRNTPRLNLNSAPDGRLNNLMYPHGIRFSTDDKYILVADAGAPYVNVYERQGDSWSGRHNPVTSVRAMDQEVYLRGRANPQEGGPKGIDIDRTGSVLVATCEMQTLAFFDLPAILNSRVVPIEWHWRIAKARVEHFRENVQVMRNRLAIGTRIRRMCGLL